MKVEKPLFMWAGGKSKMIKRYAPFLPRSINLYIEPFFGGGAMFLHLVKNATPKNVVINDINQDIMNIYRSIQNDAHTFISRMDELESQYIPLSIHNRKDFYFTLRTEHAFDYEKWDQTIQSATLYFLMKTGFNGIYQVNKNTNYRYGTPSGLLNQKSKVYEKGVVLYWNKILQPVVIKSVDWKDIVLNTEENTFLFLDPPYRGSDTSYGQSFTDTDQLDLLDFCNKTKSSFLLCNRDLGDGFFESKIQKNINIEYFDVTYTAGRKKILTDGFEAKKAREVLIHNRKITDHGLWRN